MNLFPIASLLLVPVLTLPAAVPAPRIETRSEALAMGGRLKVTQLDGDLTIEGWDKPEVAIRAEFHDGVFGPKASLVVKRVADGLEVSVKRPGLFPHLTFRFGHGVRCHLTLTVPRKLILAARTVDGGISLNNLEGFADLHTVDGAILLQDLAGEVQAHAVDGQIKATRLQARLKGGTVDGRIILEQVSGGLDLHTIDGRITAQDLDGWGEGISLSTVDGSIHLKLGAAKGHLEARTMDGGIRVTNPAVVLEETRKHLFRGHIPGRQQAISLKTVDGDITVE